MSRVSSDESAPACPHCGRHDTGHDVAKAAAVQDARAFVRHVCDGHALLGAFKRELESLCTNKEQNCPACPRLDVCNELSASVVTRLLNAATDLVREEQAYMNRNRANAQRRRYFAEHAASHDLMINDLSAYAMDCGRLPPIDLIEATALLLKYWTESHAGFHDGVLCDMALNETPAAR